MGAGGPQAPSGGSQGSSWWWLPNAAFAMIGLGLVGLGVYDHDNQLLVTGGLSTIALTVGHAVGVKQPTP